MPITVSKEKLALVLILLFAAVLRLSWVTWSLPGRFHTATYNCDESTALTALQGMNPAKLDFNPVSDKHPCALSEGTFNIYTYGAVLKALSLVKYTTLTPDKDFYYSNIGEMAKLFLAGRLLSVFYGLLTVGAVFVLAKKMFGPGAGLLAAFFTALMPAHVVSSRYIIMNVPGAFWIVLAFVFMKKILDEGRARDYFLAGLATGLAAATRLSAAPLALLLPLAHFLGTGPDKSAKKLWLALSAMGLFFFIGAPYTFLDFPNFMKGMQALNNVASAGGGLSFVQNAAFLAGSMNQALGLPLFLLCLLGLGAALVRRGKDELLLLAWISLLLVFFYRAGPFAIPSRILPALPFMAVLAAAALSRAWRHAPWAGRAALAAVAVHAFFFYGAYFRLLAAPDIRDTASEWMTGNIRPGASIGLLREPSWFTPGLIDRKYRHPGHPGLPDYKYVTLPAGDPASALGYDKLAELRPDYVIMSDLEEQLLPERGFSAAAKKYGYAEIKNFEARFTPPGLSPAEKIPEMLYTPNRISVYRRVQDPEKGR